MGVHISTLALALLAASTRAQPACVQLGLGSAMADCASGRVQLFARPDCAQWAMLATIAAGADVSLLGGPTWQQIASCEPPAAAPGAAGAQQKASRSVQSRLDGNKAAERYSRIGELLDMALPVASHRVLRSPLAPDIAGSNEFTSVGCLVHGNSSIGDDDDASSLVETYPVALHCSNVALAAVPGPIPPQAEYLHFSRNAIASLPADLLVNASHVKFLGLNNNKLTAFPVGLLTGQASLEYVQVEQATMCCNFYCSFVLQSALALIGTPTAMLLVLH
eukprot:m.181352 g.181352  ORF g.181352 m.181352 type:complete len:278 (+) comp9996_c5_seq1:672-1505(+)